MIVRVGIQVGGGQGPELSPLGVDGPPATGGVTLARAAACRERIDRRFRHWPELGFGSCQIFRGRSEITPIVAYKKFTLRSNHEIIEYEYHALPNPPCCTSTCSLCLNVPSRGITASLSEKDIEK